MRILRMNLQDDDVDCTDVERLICSAQQTADELDVNTARSMFFEDGRYDLHNLRRNHRFKKVYLLRVVLLCAEMKSSWRLAEVCKDVIDLLLPPGLKAMIGPLADIKHVMPHASTVSRYRTLLDGAFMLFMRKANRDLAAGRGAVRYMLADSSFQHGLDFEAVMTLTVEKRHLLTAWQAADELIELRTCLHTYL